MRLLQLTLVLLLGLGAATSHAQPALSASDYLEIEQLLELDELSRIVGWLSVLTLQERNELPGVSRARAGQILGGALVAEAAMELLGATSLEICPWALREGLLLRVQACLQLTEDLQGQSTNRLIE